MEVIKSTGVEVYIDSQPVSCGQCWSTTPSEGLWLGVMLQGAINIRYASADAGTWNAGELVFFRAEDGAETCHTAVRGSDVSGVFVHVPADNIEQVIGLEGAHLLSRHSGQRLMLHSYGDQAETKVTNALGWQMFGATANAAERRLFVAGKALEMLSLFLRSLNRDSGAVSSCKIDGTRDWSPRDIQSFHEARVILMDRLQDPPGVSEIALAVGMNARKLSQGFLDLFGEPVYSFVKSQRLIGARAMIEAGETSVARVAYSFGYQPGHFSTEFRKRFGISPSVLTGRRDFKHDHED
ncbi:AraC family transcriptional regulator [Nisaea sp.]|uniref:helix-turn-helix transcriptional regulator n=1 Tax=Nisaea sp. TaxID=2024842 RepID=UPI003298A2F0